jgi:hypothetical protein
MRENRTSGLTSGVWKQGMEKRVRHRQPKGADHRWAFSTLLRHTPTLHAGRRRFGHIVIANSDSGAHPYVDGAIDQAHRDVQELVRSS